MQGEVPTVADPTDGKRVGILRRGHPFREAPQRRPPQFRRGPLAQRFMRAFVVVVLAEAIEATLLRTPVPCRRDCGFLLERAMYALMGAVMPRAANGVALSVRIAWGSPASRNTFSKTRRVSSPSVPYRA